VAHDGAGNIVVDGWSESPDFPATAGVFQPALRLPPDGGIGRDGVIAKLSPTGDRVVWASFLGGTDPDDLLDIAVDSTGAVYVTGDTYSTDFPGPAPDGGNTIEGGNGDLTVAKVSPDGTRLLWAQAIGGPGSEFGFRIAADGRGNSVVIANTG